MGVVNEEPVCDFCNDGDPVVAYGCRDFAAPVVGLDVDKIIVYPWDSEGGWAACRACALLIDANDQAGLTARAMELMMPKRNPAHREMLTRVTTTLHKAFMRNRTTRTERR